MNGRDLAKRPRRNHANRSALIREIVLRTGVDREVAETVLSATIDAIIDSAKRDGSVSIRRFGKFRFQETKERRSRVPGKDSEITIPSFQTIRFTPSPLLRGILAERRPAGSRAIGRSS